LPSKKTTAGQYYAEIMSKLHDAIKQKRWGNCQCSDKDFVERRV